MTGGTKTTTSKGTTGGTVKSPTKK
jgi:hypothetical protein